MEITILATKLATDAKLSFAGTLASFALYDRKSKPYMVEIVEKPMI